jgi:hypothetical protein
MPLNTVQHYLRDAIDGLQIPLPGSTPLDCYITPPVLQDMDGPHAYVWGSRVSVGRQTMPRGAGFKRYPWRMSTWVVYETAATIAGQTNPTLDSEFPVIIDAVTNLLSGLPMVDIVTDPDTGQYSQIQSVGESWDFEYPTVRLPQNMRMLWYGAYITGDVLEVVQQ